MSVKANPQGGLKRINKEAQDLNASGAVEGLRVRAEVLPAADGPSLYHMLFAIDLPATLADGTTPSPLAGKTLPIVVPIPKEYPFKVPPAISFPKPKFFFRVRPVAPDQWSPALSVAKLVVHPIAQLLSGQATLPEMAKEHGGGTMPRGGPTDDAYAVLAQELDGARFKHAYPPAPKAAALADIGAPYHHGEEEDTGAALAEIRADGDALAAAPAGGAAAAPVGPVPLLITTLTGKKITVEAELSCTVAELKEKIVDKEGMATSQRLIYNGKQLKDEDTLASYGVVAGATLQSLVVFDCPLCTLYRFKLEPQYHDREGVLAALGRVAAELPDANMTMEQVVAFIKRQ